MASDLVNQSIKNEAYRIVLGQFAVMIGLAFIVFILKGTHNGLSALLGGCAYVLPNLLFVWRVFRYASLRQIEKFMAAFFFGETMKLLLSAILFVLIVKYLSVQVVWTLVGYIGAIVAFWVASYVCLSK